MLRLHTEYKACPIAIGTFGLGNAIAAWLTVYLASQYNLSLTLAALGGSLTIMCGMLFRPLGGILIARDSIQAVPLLRIGTIMGFIGVVVLALPMRHPLLALLGMALIGIGSTIPYTAVFNSAANLRTVSKGTAQGIVSLYSCPTAIIGPPLIGLLVDRTGSYTLGFGSILFFGAIAVIDSLLAGPALRKETNYRET